MTYQNQAVHHLEETILAALAQMEVAGGSVDVAQRARAARAALTGLPNDTSLMDYIERKAIKGWSYKGITSANVIVHEDDLVKGARFAITKAMEREAQKGGNCENGS